MKNFLIGENLEILAHLNIIVELEKEFNISFLLEEIPLMDSIDEIEKSIQIKITDIN